MDGYRTHRAGGLRQGGGGVRIWREKGDQNHHGAQEEKGATLSYHSERIGGESNSSVVKWPIKG
eukprot:6597512-Pyramimonas_sp.AAC.1